MVPCLHMKLSSASASLHPPLLVAFYPTIIYFGSGITFGMGYTSSISRGGLRHRIRGGCWSYCMGRTSVCNSSFWYVHRPQFHYPQTALCFGVRESYCTSTLTSFLQPLGHQNLSAINGVNIGRILLKEYSVPCPKAKELRQNYKNAIDVSKISNNVLSTCALQLSFSLVAVV